MNMFKLQVYFREGFANSSNSQDYICKDFLLKDNGYLRIEISDDEIVYFPQFSIIKFTVKYAKAPA